MSNNVVTMESVRSQPDPETERREEFRQLGIYIPQMLKEARQAQATQSYLVDGLLRTGSINLLVGDSGLGKTPLAIQVGVCVAAGIPLFGLNVRQGRVLYCDAESDLPGFDDILGAISRHLGLSEPPLGFHVWSPNWSTSTEGAWGEELSRRVLVVEPALVVADPLRMFWPSAETKNEDAVRTITSLRELGKSTGTSWLISHHRRKVHQQALPVELDENPHAWFQEAAGAHALVNQSDSRLGVVPGRGQADLVVAGFMRGTGLIPPLNLARATDTEGVPIGYRHLQGVEHLPPEDRRIFEGLEATFRFKDVAKALGGTSGSNTQRLVDRFRSLGIVQKQGKCYVKTESSSAKPMECVE